MYNERTNLLPASRQRAVLRNYFLRLGVVTAVLVAALLFAAAALLLPTYVYLSASEKAKQAHLASIESALSSADESALSSRLIALSNDAAVLTALQDAPSASATVRALLGILRPGVTLSSITYASPSGAARGTLAVSGIAATRDALRSYQLALQNAPFAANADLPVSAYAKDSDIPFTITVTLAP